MRKFSWSERADFAGKLGIVGFFTAAAALRAMAIAATLANWRQSDAGEVFLGLAADLSVLLFLATVVTITVFRLKPAGAAAGMEPRVSALAGTFLLILLTMISPAHGRPAVAVVASTALVITGSLLSAYVLTWLGRSFSIMAEARKLVTGGPYRLVRHPLYVVEEISAIGVIILNFSWQAVLLGLVHWAIQVRRMHNEERILRATFSEYDAYARRTGRIVPRLGGAARRAQA